MRRTFARRGDEGCSATQSRRGGIYEAVNTGCAKFVRRVRSVQKKPISIEGAMCPKRIVTGTLELTGVLEYWSEGPMPGEYRFHPCSRHI